MATRLKFDESGHNEEMQCPRCGAALLMYVNFDWEVVEGQCPICHGDFEMRNEDTYSYVLVYEGSGDIAHG